MSHIFTGAHVSRQAINLGGIGGTQGQPSDLIKRAMQQREEREHNRKRDQAAARIQVSVVAAWGESASACAPAADDSGVLGCG